MHSRLQLARQYLYYYLTASNGKGHGIHSPFVFDFIIHVLGDRQIYPAYGKIEAMRRQLKANTTVLEIEDMGAGSVLQSTRYRKIGDLARHAAKPKKWGQLLFRMSQYYRPAVMLELGTSLGLSAAYLASGNPAGRLYTLEGAGSVAEVASGNFRSLGLSNVELIRGNFDRQLPLLLERAGQIDLAFIDGNHRKEPTLDYFNRLMARTSLSSVLIFDDIHWSEEMESAWEEIRRDDRVYMTIDLFFIGLVFLRSEFKVKQDFTIRF